MATKQGDYIFWGAFIVALTGLTYFNRNQCLNAVQRAREYGFTEGFYR